MKTSHKVAIGAGVVGAVGLGIFLWSRKRKPVSGTAYLGEYNVSGCDCYQTEYFDDGTTRSTKVDRSHCADDFASASLAHCKDSGGAGLVSLASAAWANLFPGVA